MPPSADTQEGQGSSNNTEVASQAEITPSVEVVPQVSVVSSAPEAAALTQTEVTATPGIEDKSMAETASGPIKKILDGIKSVFRSPKPPTATDTTSGPPVGGLGQNHL